MSVGIILKLFSHKLNTIQLCKSSLSYQYAIGDKFQQVFAS
jgi:hypothetical protein